MTPAEYIESIISRIAALEFVAKTNLLREFSNTQKGHLRMRIAFTDGSFLVSSHQIGLEKKRKSV